MTGGRIFAGTTRAVATSSPSRSLPDPLRPSGNARLRSNPWLSRTVVVSLGVQAATVLLPPLRGLLGTTLIMPADALVVGAAATLPYLGIEAMKRPAPPVVPAPAALISGSAS